MASTYTTTNIGGFNFPDYELMLTGETSATRWAFDGLENLPVERPQQPSFDQPPEEESALSESRDELFPSTIDPDALALFSQGANEHNQVLSHDQTSVSNFGDALSQNLGRVHGGEGQWASGSKDHYLPASKYASDTDGIENLAEYYGGFDREGIAYGSQAPYPPVCDNFTQELILPVPRFSPEPEGDVHHGRGEHDGGAQGGVGTGVLPLLRPRPVRAGVKGDAAPAPAPAPARHRRINDQVEITVSRPADGRRTRRADRRAGVEPYARLPSSPPRSPPPAPSARPPSPQLSIIPRSRRLRSQTGTKPSSSDAKGKPGPKAKAKPKPKSRSRTSKSISTLTHESTTSDAPPLKYDRVQTQRGMRFILPCLLPDCPLASSPSPSTPSTPATFVGWEALKAHLIDEAMPHKLAAGKGADARERCVWPGFRGERQGPQDGKVARGNHVRTIERLQGIRYVCGGAGCAVGEPRIDNMNAHWVKDHGRSKEEAVYDEVYKD